MICIWKNWRRSPFFDCFPLIISWFYPVRPADRGWSRRHGGDFLGSCPFARLLNRGPDLKNILGSKILGSHFRMGVSEVAPLIQGESPTATSKTLSCLLSLHTRRHMKNAQKNRTWGPVHGFVSCGWINIKFYRVLNWCYLVSSVGGIGGVETSADGPNRGRFKKPKFYFV